MSTVKEVSKTRRAQILAWATALFGCAIVVSSYIDHFYVAWISACLGLVSFLGLRKALQRRQDDEVAVAPGALVVPDPWSKLRPYLEGVLMAGGTELRLHAGKDGLEMAARGGKLREPVVLDVLESSSMLVRLVSWYEQEQPQGYGTPWRSQEFGPHLMQVLAYREVLSGHWTAKISLRSQGVLDLDTGNIDHHGSPGAP